MNAPGTTSTNWLNALRQRDREAWNRLAEIYGPLVYGIARRQGLEEADAQDVSQEVFRKVLAGIADFRRDRPGDSFRGWLRIITRNAIIDYQRRSQHATPAVGGTDAQQRLLDLPAPPQDANDSANQAFSRAEVLRRAVELFSENQHKTAWRAFWRTELDGASAEEVAAELGVSVWAIYKGRARVLRDLRDRFGEMLD